MSYYLSSIFFLVIAGISSGTFLKFLIPRLNYIKLFDIPNERSSHEKTKVNGGGISFILVTLIGSFLRGNFELIALIPIAVIGLIDDKLKISSLFRFFAQAVTVVFLLNGSIFYESLKTNNLILNNIIFIFLVIFGIGLINCINFMDGVDGLIGSSTIPAILLGSISFYNSGFLLVGALLGFLFWNWYPSKVFMGDTGSLFIGSFLCFLIFKSPEIKTGISIILILSPLILDTGTTIIKRFMNKENIFISHKSHLYQRLHQKGLTHSQVSLIYFYATLFLFFIATFKDVLILFLGTFIICIIGLYLNNIYLKN
tara:strand:+ start:31522 stop:32460 length:939 start_codon:yes stop_codon:yes gene_type:complete